jgi:hypothetical protein
MTPEQLAALQAPKAVKNASVHEALNFLFPQLTALGLHPAGLFAVPTGVMAATGSGPNGTLTLSELTDLGVGPEDRIYLQFQVGPAVNNSLFDAADAIRILQGYRSDSTLEPDPNFWYVDRVKTLYKESFQVDDIAAINAMLYMPAVKAAVEQTLRDTITKS